MDNKNNRNNGIIVKSTRNNTKNSTTTKNKKIKNNTRSSTKKIKSNNSQKAKIYSIETARNDYNNTRNLRTNTVVQNKKLENNTRTKRKNNRNTALFANVFSVIIFGFIIIYFSVFFIKFFTTDSVSYSNVELGTIDSPKSATGIIIRNEEIYTASQDGFVTFNVANNEKVKADTIIATIKSEEVLLEMEQELENINKEILSLQDSRAELSWFSEDVKRINLKIEEIVDDNIYELVENDISKLYEISNNIQNNIDIRNQMLLSETTGSLSDLATKRTEQENKINANSTVVKSTQSGILSYYTDGLEEVLTVDNMLGLTKEQTTMSTNTETIRLQVSENEPILKIINSNDWYIATYLDSSFVEGWEKGQTKTIYVKDGLETKELETSVYYIEKGTKETFMILKLTKNMLDYINTRSITFELDKVKVGFKISNESIAEQNLLKIPISFTDEQGTIIKVTDNGNVKLTLDLSYENNDLEFAYIPISTGAINIGDTIVNPDDLTQTYTITDVITSKGVYTINTGITKFVKINLENSVSNNKYTILDQSLNTGLTIYDHIISDITNIEKEQIIYK